MTTLTIQKKGEKTEHDRPPEEAKKQLGGKLDYLDDLPNAPKKPEIPFPYGRDTAKPYGWFSS